MIEEQGMAELEAEEREIFLDYLARHFNEDIAPAAGGGQPLPAQ